MNKLFYQTIRRCSSKKISPKSQSWYLMGTAYNENQIEKNVLNFLRKDLIYAHRSFFNQYVNEAARALEGEEFFDIRERFKNVCHYNGLDRDQYLCWTMLASYELSEEPDEITQENLKKISMLAWAFESVGTSLVLTDDLIDSQEIRWKKPTWYRLPNVGNTVITDIDLLRITGFYMIRKYFRRQPYYESLCYYLTEICHITAVGQTMGIHVSNNFKQHRDINMYNLKKYFQLARYKCYISIFRSCTLAALSLTDTTNEYFKYEHIFEKLGSHGQITNDMHDLFGKYDSFGRGSTDIEEGKFSWVVSVAVEHANDNQKLLLQKNYGRPEPECQRIVLDVCKDIDVIQKFYDYKTQLLDDVRNDLKTVPNQKIANIIENYINMYIDVNYDFASY
ncbi:hypothetical protein FQR65_LT12367 [Abscondita terminalis]|nr:hypothetical protein FQR65_LT12367 [Abscondita terminalis]